MAEQLHWPSTWRVTESTRLLSIAVQENMQYLELWINSFIASGTAIDHGALTGLGDDDHPHYLLADGSRVMTGRLLLDTLGLALPRSGANDIFIVATANGIQVQDEATGNATMEFDYTNQQITFKTPGTATTRFRIDQNGDLRLADDAGATKMTYTKASDTWNVIGKLTGDGDGPNDRSFDGNVGTRARRTADQAIAAATWTFINWTAEDSDDNAWHNNVTDNERITVDTAGWYVFSATIAWLNVAAGDRVTARILRNATTAAAGATSEIARVDEEVATGSGTRHIQSVTGLFKMAANDHAEVSVFTDAANDVEWESSNFSVARLF